MIARYLGNKSSILQPLMGTIGDLAAPGEHVVDAFSGSLTVSMALKANGYRVTANDINLFSAVFSDAYLIPTKPTDPDLSSLLPSSRIVELLPEAKALAEGLKGQPGYLFLDSPEYARRYINYLLLLRHLETAEAKSVPTAYRRTDFYDTYCEDGENSAFTSSRGTTGRRRFFIPQNAARIDTVMNQLRAWHQQNLIDSQTLSTLLSGLVRAVERVSNTQGTFHDFIRDKWDSRALNPLRFEALPLDDVVVGPGGHSAGREQDSLQFIAEVDEHAVLYLDPPYNFRQYSAYYFMPNVLCRYPEMDDPAHYFSQVKFVRGQNPNDDFTSTFCKASSFIKDMRALITRAQCRTVVVSYFNGATHWGKFDSEGDDSGRTHLTEMLSDADLFQPGSLRVLEVPRRNYASYGGYTARSVTELLLVADKRQNTHHAAERGTNRGLQPVA